MSGRPLQGSRGSLLSSSSRQSDGLPSQSSMVGGSSSSARRRASGNMGGGRAGSSNSRDSTSGKQGRSLQEISIPEGMDEEVRSTAAVVDKALTVHVLLCSGLVVVFSCL